VGWGSGGGVFTASTLPWGNVSAVTVQTSESMGREPDQRVGAQDVVIADLEDGETAEQRDLAEVWAAGVEDVVKRGIVRIEEKVPPDPQRPPVVDDETEHGREAVRCRVVPRVDTQPGYRTSESFEYEGGFVVLHVADAATGDDLWVAWAQAKVEAARGPGCHARPVAPPEVSLRLRGRRI
jgi:hypothetical protein